VDKSEGLSGKRTLGTGPVRGLPGKSDDTTRTQGVHTKKKSDRKKNLTSWERRRSENLFKRSFFFHSGRESYRIKGDPDEKKAKKGLKSKKNTPCKKCRQTLRKGKGSR